MTCSIIGVDDFGNNIEEIGTEAFWFCNNLKKVSLPNSVGKIGKNAFPSKTEVEIGMDTAMNLLKNYNGMTIKVE